MQMAGWMRNIDFYDQRPSEALKYELAIGDISIAMLQKHLRCFGHKERMLNENWVRKETQGARGRGGLCKTWPQVLKGDFHALQQ